MIAHNVCSQQEYAAEIETTDESGAKMGLSQLWSRVQDIHSKRGGVESVAAAVKVYGHDRNPFISPLKASDCRLSTDFSIGWSDGKDTSTAISPSGTKSDRPISKEVEEFASLIPDLSFMLSDKLCLPK